MMVEGDMDLLMEFKKTSWEAYMGLKFFLEDHPGRPVDLVVRHTLKAARNCPARGSWLRQRP